MNAAVRERALDEMNKVSNAFYGAAVRIGNHPFIEFAGLMNEYIKACRNAHREGLDFSECSTHSGVDLPMQSFEIDYVNEKLECIFTGRALLKPNVEVEAPLTALRKDEDGTD